MKANAYYTNKFPTHLLIEFNDAWFITPLSPFRAIKETELKPLKGSADYIEAITKEKIPSYLERFYGINDDGKKVTFTD